MIGIKTKTTVCKIYQRAKVNSFQSSLQVKRNYINEMFKKIPFFLNKCNMASRIVRKHNKSVRPCSI